MLGLEYLASIIRSLQHVIINIRPPKHFKTNVQKTWLVHVDICICLDVVTKLKTSGHFFSDCSPGRYGSACSKMCSARHCEGDSTCDHTGRCVGGCQSGWTGTDCMTGGQYNPLLMFIKLIIQYR